MLTLCNLALTKHLSCEESPDGGSAGLNKNKNGETEMARVGMVLICPREGSGFSHHLVGWFGKVFWIKVKGQNVKVS